MKIKLFLAVLLWSTASVAIDPPRVSTYWYRGTQVDVQSLDGVTVQVSLMQLGNVNQVAIRVINSSDSSVDVQPQLISLAITSPKHIDLKSLSERDLLRSISRRQLVGNILIGFSASMATQTSTVRTTTSNGYSATSTIRTPDYTAQSEAYSSRHRLNASVQEWRDGIHQSILLHTTVFPKESLLGSAFFKRAGKMDGAVLKFSLGERTFEFPFGDATPESALATSRPKLDNYPESTTPATAAQHAENGNLQTSLSPQLAAPQTAKITPRPAPRKCPPPQTGGLVIKGAEPREEYCPKSEK